MHAAGLTLSFKLLLITLSVSLVSSAARAQADFTHDDIEWRERVRTTDGRFGVVRPLEGFEQGWFFRRLGKRALLPTESDLADLAALEAALPDDAADGGFVFELDGARVLQLRSSDDPPERSVLDPVAVHVFVSGQTQNDAIRLERTWVATYEPIALRDRDNVERGIAVVLPGMFGTPENVVDQMVLTLQQRGWHVLLVLGQPSRFTERTRFTIEPHADDAAAQLETFAADVSSRAAEMAYAVEAVAGVMLDERPQLRDLRRVIIGMSGGGLATPATIAREPDAYEAVLLVGTGADTLSMTVETSYANFIDSMRIDFADGQRRLSTPVALADAYRKLPALDAYHLAPLMADIPTLILHATRDTAVPAHLGDLLWVRLGRPERWEVPVGHELLFLAVLPRRMPELADWLVATTGQPEVIIPIGDAP
ncbi:MAG: alpha/beta hydrolase [Planctomycetota bacterium]